MPLSPEKLERARRAIVALHDLREEYADVLVVLDYVVISDIAKSQTDSDETPVGDTLSEDELSSVLWRLGKHVGSAETSQNLLPALIQFAVDEHERRDAEQP